MKQHPALILCTLFLSVLSLAAKAQVGVYGEFSAAKSNLGQGTESGNWLYGGTGGIYFDRGHLAILETGLDARALFVFQGKSGDFISDKLVGGFVGPRLAVRTRVLPLKPYGEALVGVTRTEGSGQNDSRSPNPSQTSFAYQLVAGADLTILPHIDWRVLEFNYTGIPSLNQGGGISTNISTETLSSGFVIRF